MQSFTYFVEIELLKYRLLQQRTKKMKPGKQYIQCRCGNIVIITGLVKHQRTKKHLNGLHAFFTI